MRIDLSWWAEGRARDLAPGPRRLIPLANSRIDGDSEVGSFAGLFVQLQEQRHEADYNIKDAWTLTQSLKEMLAANRAFASGSRDRSDSVMVGLRNLKAHAITILNDPHGARIFSSTHPFKT
jgi:hypothetical protein